MECTPALIDLAVRVLFVAWAPFKALIKGFVALLRLTCCGNYIFIYIIMCVYVSIHVYVYIRT